MLEVYQSEDVVMLSCGMWRVCTMKYRRLVCRRRWQSFDSLSAALQFYDGVGELGVFDGSLLLEFVELQLPGSFGLGAVQLPSSRIGSGLGFHLGPGLIALQLPSSRIGSDLGYDLSEAGWDVQA